MVPKTITLETMDRVPTLPYFPTYDMWCDHLDDCKVCAKEMVEGDQLVEKLCWEGQGLQFALDGKLAAQADLAALN